MAALLSALALAAPALSDRALRFNTPIGYNDHDYQTFVAFMEKTDENGVRNGEKVVVPFDGYYLPAFPVTWSYYYYDHEIGQLYMYGVFFTDDEEDARACSLWLYDMDLVGPLDFEGCDEMYEVYCDRNRITSVNASGCADLRAMTCSRCEIESLCLKGCVGLDLLDCSRNRMTELDASGCPAITDIECNDNKLSCLDVNGCEELCWLDCFNNALTSLDLTSCGQMYCLDCTGNPLKKIELPEAAPLKLECLLAEGGGTVCYSGSTFAGETVYAYPAAGEEFLGWYTEAGEHISNNPQLTLTAQTGGRLVARFSSPAPLMGDVDGNGSVNANDALALMRYALGLVTDIDLAAADVNGDGAVNANDALLIMRYALGLAEL